MKKVVYISLCMLVACTVTKADFVDDDLFAPQWHGEWSTTFQYWDFNTPETGQGLADGLTPDGPGPLDEGQGVPGVPYVDQGGSFGYLPGTHVVVHPGSPWMQTDTTHGSARQGIFPLSGSIDVVVNNHDALNEYKLVRVQVTWAKQHLHGTGTPAPDFINMAPAADPSWPVTQIGEVDHGDGWKTSAYEWRIYPNPEEERFTLAFDTSALYNGIIVDSLIVDTWCIPEPSSIAMLGVVSGLGLFLRRRFVV